MNTQTTANVAKPSYQPATWTQTRYYPWLIVVMSSLFLFYKYILQVSPSVMTSELMATFHVNATGLGNLAATYFYTYLVVQLFVGPLLDRYSPRLLTSFAILICAASALQFTFASSLLGAEMARAMMGVGAAFATVSYLKLASMWFSPQKFAFVGGLLATAASMGAFIGQAPLAYSVQTAGWHQTLVYCAVLGAVIAAVYFLLVRDKQAFAEQTESFTVNYSSLLTLLKNKKNWVLTVYSGLAWAPLAVFSGLWGNPFLQEAYHLTKTQSASCITLAFVGLAVGGPLFGWVALRLGKLLPVMVFGISLSTLSMALVVFNPLHTLWLLNLSLFLLGLGTGSFMLGFVLGKNMNASYLAASVIALINTGDAVFGAFTEPLVGRILDHVWSGKVVQGVHFYSVANYQQALLILPLYLAAALGCLWWLACLMRRCSAIIPNPVEN